MIIPLSLDDIDVYKKIEILITGCAYLWQGQKRGNKAFKKCLRLIVNLNLDNLSEVELTFSDIRDMFLEMLIEL